MIGILMFKKEAIFIAILLIGPILAILASVVIEILYNLF